MLTLYGGLFLTAFLAATILPGYSEVALLAALKTTAHPLVLWLVASAGNTLGSVLNWWLGGRLLHFRNSAWFPVRARELERAQRWFQRYGVWSLLLAWAPIGGDGLTVVAGILKVRLLPFVALVATGKAARYAALILLAEAGGWTAP